MSRKAMSRRLILLALVAVVVPALPFLIFGESYEMRLQEWVASRDRRSALFWGTVLLLSGDLVLPVPSSGLSTLAGAVLGVARGVSAVWLGMTLGSVLGFLLARLLGRPLVLRHADADDVQALEEWTARSGPSILVLMRPLPVLAEASTLLAGASGMPWRVFLFIITLSNAAVAAVYVSFGAWVGESRWLSWAVGASLVLPLALTWMMRDRLRAGASQHGGR